MILLYTITKSLIEKYKELYPDKKLPILDNGTYAKDYNLLEDFYSQYLLKEKDTQIRNDFLSDLRKNVSNNEEKYLKSLYEDNTKSTLEHQKEISSI